MYEFTVINNRTNEELIYIGHTFESVCNKRGLDLNDYTVILCDYID